MLEDKQAEVSIHDVYLRYRLGKWPYSVFLEASNSSLLFCKRSTIPK